jgi:2,3-bisphosphoglycerate-dependent phosphoglycerate mutase
MQKLVLLRHGESLWNLENRFTGWTDVDLSPTGVEQAKHAGQVLKANGFSFERAYTSVLKRAIKTLHFVLDEMDQLYIPEEKTWHLNERFYGALQGLNKAEIVKQYGEEQVHKWRRDPREHPPALDRSDERFPGKDARYKELQENELPVTENLSETMDRVLPFWVNTIVPVLKQRKEIIIVAHGNSLRALIQYVDHLTDEEVTGLDIPTGVPWVYELNDDLSKRDHYYLK